ncbi:hypothetical protein [Azoarcus sp. KH32C]|uniref:hypothetical protein n=1 Tax=Azoarcus sp. KH32C TaxID=748247 RepID=UPI0012EAA26A|nr:hypothetical protein [Azoarcus sp. KH32C]
MSTEKENTYDPTEAIPPGLAAGVLVGIWFAANIDGRADCMRRFDLQPHAAICLLIMTTETVTSGDGIAQKLSLFGYRYFSRREALIVAEEGLYSLKENGYIRLDARGKRELKENDHHTWGLGDIQWLLTAKGAKTIVASYCACKGLDSSHQAQAVKDILAANKKAVADFRMKQKES